MNRIPLIGHVTDYAERTRARASYINWINSCNQDRELGALAPTPTRNNLKLQRLANQD